MELLDVELWIGALSLPLDSSVAMAAKGILESLQGLLSSL